MVLLLFVAATTAHSASAAELSRKGKDVLVGVNYFPGWWKPLPNKWQDRRGGGLAAALSGTGALAGGV